MMRYVNLTGVSLICIVIFIFGTKSWAQESSEEFQEAPKNAIEFQDIIALQKVPFPRKGKFIFGIHSGMGFSDGPKSRQDVTLSMGYGLTKFWELGVYYTPTIINSERAISKALKNVDAGAGYELTIPVSDPVSAMGGEIHWFFGNGKDMFKEKVIWRSETFLHLSGGTVKFKGGEAGTDTLLGLGKLFYFNKYFNMRFEAAVASRTKVYFGKSASETEGILDIGFVW